MPGRPSARTSTRVARFGTCASLIDSCTRMRLAGVDGSGALMRCGANEIGIGVVPVRLQGGDQHLLIERSRDRPSRGSVLSVVKSCERMHHEAPLAAGHVEHAAHDVARQRHEGAALDAAVGDAVVVDLAAVGDGVAAGLQHGVVLHLRQEQARQHLRVDVRLLQAVGDDGEAVEVAEHVVGDRREVVLRRGRSSRCRSGSCRAWLPTCFW